MKAKGVFIHTENMRRWTWLFLIVLLVLLALAGFWGWQKLKVYEPVALPGMKKERLVLEGEGEEFDLEWQNKDDLEELVESWGGFEALGMGQYLDENGWQKATVEQVVIELAEEPLSEVTYVRVEGGGR